ncbi:auxin-responsive family protein [Striga asiatica]|uniref:Auxin-responsive family protein n=1 Tax=Striga asiatica TaxID=4170 RepID=A0A5A7P069_STRAF|nr:auxin-responsive family protein [Striga asiatica]
MGMKSKSVVLVVALMLGMLVSLSHSETTSKLCHQLLVCLNSVKIHGALNVVPKAFNVANPAWFYYLHVTCHASAYIIGVAGWAMGLKLGHTAMALFVLAVLQAFVFLFRPKPDHKYRIYWNVFAYHQSIGYTVIALSIANIIEGLEISGPQKKWKQAYIFTLIAFGAVALSMEALRCSLEALRYQNRRRAEVEAREPVPLLCVQVQGRRVLLASGSSLLVDHDCDRDAGYEELSDDIGVALSSARCSNNSDARATNKVDGRNCHPPLREFDGPTTSEKLEASKGEPLSVALGSRASVDGRAKMGKYFVVWK